MNSNVDQISCDVEKEEFQPEKVTQDENLEKEISQEFFARFFARFSILTGLPMCNT